MNLQYSDEQQLFAEALTRFVDERCGFESRRSVVASEVWGGTAIWAGLAGLGCFGVTVPEAAGGFGGGMIETGLVARAAGRRLLIEPIVPALMAGVLLGGVEGADAYIANLISGEIRFAILPSLSARTVSGGMAATAFLVADDAGLQLVQAQEVRRTPVRMLDDSQGADVTVEGAGERFVPNGDWIATRAAAAAVETIALCWQAYGAMEQGLADTARHLRERHQFGKPLADFQVVQHRVAEMAVAVKEAEVAALLAALTFDAAGPGLRADRALAAASHCIAAGANIVAGGAVQMHGGMGVSDELDVSARFRVLQAIRARLRTDGRYAAHVMPEGLHRYSAVLEAA